MSKISIIVLAVCLFGCSSAHSKSISVESHHPVHSVHHVEVVDHSEVYSSLANGVFEFLAKLVRAKVEVLLWIKKAILELLIRGLAQLRYLMVHERDTVNGVVDTVAELLKLLVTKKPHFAVGHVSKIISEAEHVYIPQYGHY